MCIYLTLIFSVFTPREEGDGVVVCGGFGRSCSLSSCNEIALMAEVRGVNGHTIFCNVNIEGLQQCLSVISTSMCLSRRLLPFHSLQPPPHTRQCLSREWIAAIGLGAAGALQKYCVFYAYLNLLEKISPTFPRCTCIILYLLLSAVNSLYLGALPGRGYGFAKTRNRKLPRNRDLSTQLRSRSRSALQLRDHRHGFGGEMSAILRMLLGP